MARRRPSSRSPRLAFAAIAAALLALDLSCSPGPTVPSPPKSPAGDWTLLEPKPLHQDLHAVYAAARHQVWAVGDGGIIRFDGWNSQPVYSGTDRPLYAIHGTGPSDIFAVGFQVVVHFDGTRWTPTSLRDYDLSGVWCRAPDDVFAVGREAILHYDGHLWSEVASCPQPLFAVLGAGRTVCAVGYGVAAVSNGSDWKFVELGNDVILNCLYYTGRDWIAGGSQGTEGVYYVSVDNGQSWKLERSVPGSGAVLSIASNGLDLVATTGSKLLGLSSGHGEEDPLWTDPARKVTALAGWPSDPALMFGVGSMGTLLLLRYDLDGSMTPTVETFYEGPGASVDRLFGGADGRIYGSTYQGLLIRGDGVDWTLLSTGENAWFQSVWADSAGDVFAVGYNGMVVRGTSAGEFTRLEAGITGHAARVWGSGPDDVWVVADSPRLSHFDGSSWSAVTTGTDTAAVDVDGRGRNDVWVADANGRVLHWDGTTWSTAHQFPHDFWSWLHLVRVGPNSRTVVAAIVHGGIDSSEWEFWRFDGAEWQDLHAPWGIDFCDDLIVLGPDDIYVNSGRTVWHFDGTQWTSREEFDGVHGLWGDHAHGFYAAIQGAIWHRPIQ